MKRNMITLPAILIISLFLLGVHSPDFAWMDKYTGRWQGPCCGQEDCVPFSGGIVSDPQAAFVDVRVELLLDGHASFVQQEVHKTLTVPRAWVHVSESATSWACFVTANQDVVPRPEYGSGTLPTFPIDVSIDNIRCLFIAVGF